MVEGWPQNLSVVAHGLLEQAVDAVEAACGPGAGDADLLSALTFCEGVSRQMERLGVTALAGLMRRGVFAERGYRVGAEGVDRSPRPKSVWPRLRTSTPPADLQAWGGALVETLDQDGPEPDDRPRAQLNELHLTRHAAGSGGRIRGRFDDPAMFAAIASAVDAHAAPRTADDDRCDARVVPVVLGGAGQPLYVGRATGWFPTGCGGRSRPATGDAPAAGVRRPGARSTTSSRGSTAAPPAWPTAACCAARVTGWSTTAAGTCTCATASPSSSHRGGSTPAAHPAADPDTWRRS